MKRKCCDTCTHWKPHTPVRAIGECQAPTPECLSDAMNEYPNMMDTSWNDGENCECWREEMTGALRKFKYSEYTPAGWLQQTIEGPIDCNTAEPLRRLLLDIAEGKVDGKELLWILEDVKK